MIINMPTCRRSISLTQPQRRINTFFTESIAFARDSRYRSPSLPTSTGLPTTVSSYVNLRLAGVPTIIGVPPFHTAGAGLGVILI